METVKRKAWFKVHSSEFRVASAGAGVGEEVCRVYKLAMVL
jgi:hypothetical protein